MVLPNVHAYEYDFKKLPNVGISSNNEVSYTNSSDFLFSLHAVYISSRHFLT